MKKIFLIFIITVVLSFSVSGAMSPFVDNFDDNSIDSLLWNINDDSLDVAEVGSEGLLINGTADTSTEYTGALTTISNIDLTEDFTVIMETELLDYANFGVDDFISSKIILENAGETKYAQCSIEMITEGNQELVLINSSDGEDFTDTGNYSALIVMQWDVSTKTLKCIDRDVTATLTDGALTGTDVNLTILGGIFDDNEVGLNGNEYVELGFYGLQYETGLLYGINSMPDAVTGFDITDTSGDITKLSLPSTAFQLRTSNVPKAEFTTDTFAQGYGEVIWEDDFFIDSDASRTVVNGTDGINHVASTHALFVPATDTNGAYVCPDAEILGDVTDACSNLVNWTHSECIGSTGKSVGGDTVTCTVSGSSYKLSGLIGSGVGGNPEEASESVPEWSDLAYVLIIVGALGAMYSRRE